MNILVDSISKISYAGKFPKNFTKRYTFFYVVPRPVNGKLELYHRWWSNNFRAKFEYKMLQKSVAQRLGLHLRVLLSAMNSPIGWTVGNALEIEESICCLRGNGCPRLKRLIAVLGKLFRF